MTLENKLKKWSLAKWKKEFWKTFAIYIKKRDKGVCITCGKVGLSGYEYQAGHCIPAGASPLKLYFDERNVSGQCMRCNQFLGGMGAVYRDKVDIKFGKGTFKELEKLLGDNSIIYDKKDYHNLIEKYKQKIEDL
jgi:hypothetical protein